MNPEEARREVRRLEEERLRLAPRSWAATLRPLRRPGAWSGA
jgi:hypothetical protein